MNLEIGGSSGSLTSALMAPCGMNCGLCIGHLRERNRCPGCRGEDAGKPKHCVSCRIRNCEELVSHGWTFCLECAKFPCVRLKQLDKRYRTNYGMSMIGNLESIAQLGLDAFVVEEDDRWRCLNCGGIVCVHRETCIHCGRARK